MSIETKKRQSRIRRVNRSRGKIQQKVRLCVHRTPKHIYAQVIDATGARVLVAASSLEQSIRKEGYTGNAKSAALVGKAIAERALKKGIQSLAFDRSGYLYHGRVKSLADAAREAGLQF